MPGSTEPRKPECVRCEEPIGKDEQFVDLGGGSVRHADFEPMYDAGGGVFHPRCAIEYIEENYA